MKKIFSLIIITIIFSSNYYTNIAFAETDENDICEKPYSGQSDYGLYKYRVQCICKKGYKSNNILINIDNNYLKLNNKDPYLFNNIKKVHKKNMNDIYKCALLSIQKKSLLLIKDDLIKKNVSLNKRIGGKLNSEIERTKSKLTIFRCINSKDKNSIQKLNVLKQTTYQTCKYVSYLEYLKQYNSILENVVPKDKTEHRIGDPILLKDKRINEINTEIEHIYKIFPLVFHAYTEYENNISIHFLLGLLKDDYLILREKLHDSINPINQVVYKISNAMKK